MVSIAIVVASLAIAGFLLWRQFEPKVSAPAETSTNTEQVTPTITEPEPVDPYLGWNTYTSTRDGYELKYPAEWIVIKETKNDGPYIRNMKFTGGGYPRGYINLRVLRDEGVVSGSDLSPKVWYESLGVSTVKKGPVTFAPDTVEAYKMGEFDTKKAKSIFSEIDEDIFILRGDVLYEINMYPYGISADPVVKKILESFRFL